MKQNKNLVYLIVFLLLVLATIFIIRKNTKSTLPEKDRNFAIKDSSSITRIFLADMKGNTVTLERSGIQWLVNNKFPADQERISLLLESIAKVEVRSVVPESAKNTVIRDLASNSVKIEIYSKKKKIRAYFVGSETPDVLGTYMVLDNKRKVPFIMYIPGFEGYLTPRYFAEEAEWKSKVAFNYDPLEIKTISVEYTDSSEYSYEVTIMDERNFRISIPEKGEIPEHLLNPSRVKQYLMEFHNIQFINMVRDFSKQKTDSILNARPVNIISVTDKNDKIRTMKLFYRQSGFKTKFELMPGIDAEYFYAEVSDRPGEIGVMQTSTLRRILWKNSDFIKEK